MELLKCLVIEPDQNDRDLIQRYLDKTNMVQLMAMYSNPVEALLYLQKCPIDLIFLGFEMPELNSEAFLKILNPKPLVVITTAHQEYALQAFQLDAVDFLLKPFDFHSFLKAISKAIRLYHFSQMPPREAAVKILEKHYLKLKSNRKFYRIPTENIMYIQGMKEYVAIYLKDQSRLLFLHSLRNLEELLPADGFMRIHKSYIVANDKITALEGNDIYLGDIKIPVGESYKNRIIETIFS